MSVATHTGAAATAPAARGVAVTPSDSTVLPSTRGLYVGTGGNLAVTMLGADITFANVPAGTLLPLQVQKVLASTTAASIVALY